jgi:dTDP-4-dehydrorhamnose 3,5-epimerase
LSTRFDILDTPLAGLRLLQRKLISDNRGYLERMFCKEELGIIVPGKNIAHINHTLTKSRGTVRGMHFQHPPYAEVKFVSCLCGKVYDLAVDLRRGSPTFCHWHAELLTAENHKTLVIPEGFAHGFQTLTDDCEMLYFHTEVYCPEVECGLHAQDPRLGIQWPLPVKDLSSRDAGLPYLDDCFIGLVL